MQWSDSMTLEQKDHYMAELRVKQLIDHITSGAPDLYGVHDQFTGYGTFTDYNNAVAKFNSLTTTGHCYIYLYTRIGTGVTVLEKVNK